MNDFQERVISEKHELDIKLGKLYAFFKTKTFDELPRIDQELLQSQSRHMQFYSDILGKRILRFEK